MNTLAFYVNVRAHIVGQVDSAGMYASFQISHHSELNREMLTDPGYVIRIAAVLETTHS